MNRRNLLRRQLKPTINKLGLPASVDFRSFRTMHSSLITFVRKRSAKVTTQPHEWFKV